MVAHPAGGHKVISIHALREEGDSRTSRSTSQKRNFYPRPPRGGRRTSSLSSSATSEFLSTPSARRATIYFPRFHYTTFNFYPRPPRGGRRCCPESRCGWKQISIHALREEGDRPRSFPKKVYSISIHALREEGDVASNVALTHTVVFLSTPSARRATPQRRTSSAVPAYFYPRPPRGGRRRSSA